MAPEDRDKLNWAALLHDVGKLHVPAEILNKAGPLSPSEREVVERHPDLGAQLIGPLAGWLGPWARGVQEHHERWDGTGYPRGLAGEAISLGARIISVADAFDVMTALRSYKAPMSVAAAKRELTRWAGRQFDPTVVRAMLSVSLGRLWPTMGPLAWVAQLPVLSGARSAPAPLTLGTLSRTVVLVGVAQTLGPASLPGLYAVPAAALPSATAQPAAQVAAPTGARGGAASATAPPATAAPPAITSTTSASRPAVPQGTAWASGATAATASASGAEPHARGRPGRSRWAGARLPALAPGRSDQQHQATFPSAGPAQNAGLPPSEPPPSAGGWVGRGTIASRGGVPTSGAPRVRAVRHAAGRPAAANGSRLGRLTATGTRAKGLGTTHRATSRARGLSQPGPARPRVGRGERSAQLHPPRATEVAQVHEPAQAHMGAAVGATARSPSLAGTSVPSRTTASVPSGTTSLPMAPAAAPTNPPEGVPTLPGTGAPVPRTTSGGPVPAEGATASAVATVSPAAGASGASATPTSSPGPPAAPTTSTGQATSTAPAGSSPHGGGTPAPPAA